jgi:hypothetical protein
MKSKASLPLDSISSTLETVEQRRLLVAHDDAAGEVGERDGVREVSTTYDNALALPQRSSTRLRSLMFLKSLPLNNAPSVAKEAGVD